MKVSKVARATLLLLTMALMVDASAQVPEIPTPGLPDIAVVRATPNGPVIFYNPQLCQQVGPLLCAFYRTHEYGHVALGHAFVPVWPQVAEFQADCWAAQNAPLPVVQAAIQYFLQGGGSTPVHGPGLARAQRVGRCAGLPGF